MPPRVPRIAAAHDLSCFGRCSLSVIIPVLSALGIQACPLPTAVLSTHLGGFSGPVFCDFTDRMTGFYQHWQQETITFDCIYTGFLASNTQIDVVLRFIEQFSANQPLVLVDPVMGDEGRLYSAYTPAMQEQMKKLVARADVITPNYTEACFLLREAYQPDAICTGQLAEWLIRLTDLGPSMAVITGIPCKKGIISNLAYDKTNKTYWQTTNKQIPVRYPGTGDIFASVLAGALLQGADLRQALELAADFVAHCAAITYQAATPVREGVLLEEALPKLWNNRKEVRNRG